ncbi:MAG: TadE/TadG family type IV pilus assembly protein [Anaerolineae bacterium]
MDFILHSPFSILPFPFSLLHGQRGSNLVEFGLTVPVLLLILLAIFDMGRAVYAQNVLTHAAREGARYGTVAPDDSQGIEDQAKGLIIGLDVDSVTVLSEQPTSDIIRVTVTYEFTAVTPVIGQFLGQNGTITLQAVSSMRIEDSQ